MRFHALACDYDGTIAHHGRVDAPTLAALERVRASGRRLVLVTGRILEDLLAVFPQVGIFDRVVAENGVVIYEPESKAERILPETLPQREFVEMLERRGVQPIEVGRVIVATWEPHETVVLSAIRDLGLELQVIFNKGAVMVLPSGFNKAVGLRAALTELGLSPHNVVGAGDGENDHAFFTECEFAVAVANAVPMLQEHADWVTPQDHGAGVQQLIEALLTDDLRAATARSNRHALEVGAIPGGERVMLSPYTEPVLIAGTSGAGKSTLATSLLEQLAEHGYQYCVIDPEGDHGGLADAAVTGSANQPPLPAVVLETIAAPVRNAVVNLLGVPLADRPSFAQGLLARLFEHRGATGRPHWLVIDEAHHLLPETLEPGATSWPREPHGVLLLTVHPESVSRVVLGSVGTAIVVGGAPRDTLAALAQAVGRPPPDVPPAALAPGTAWVWPLRAGLPPVLVELRPARTERLRHVRKYATGELPSEVSFYFRGPKDALNLRAQNLQTFVQLALGVDDETWLHHLRRGDYSGWFRRQIKDEDLAAETAAVERDASLDAAASRQRIKETIERRYTAQA